MINNWVKAGFKKCHKFAITKVNIVQVYKVYFFEAYNG